MEQKFIKIGSSTGAVILKQFTAKLGIRPGTKFTTVLEVGSNRIIIEPAKQEKSAGNAEMVAWAEEAVERYRPAMEALKNK